MRRFARGVCVCGPNGQYRGFRRQLLVSKENYYRIACERGSVIEKAFSNPPMSTAPEGLYVSRPVRWDGRLARFSVSAGVRLLVRLRSQGRSTGVETFSNRLPPNRTYKISKYPALQWAYSTALDLQ